MVMEHKYAIFSILLDCKFNRNKNGSINYRYGEQLLKREFADYVKKLYTDPKLINALDDIANQMSSEFNRKVRYDLFDLHLHKTKEPVLDENDITDPSLNHILYVGFYADPEFCNLSNVVDLYDNTVLLTTKDKFNVALTAYPSGNETQTEVLAHIQLKLFGMHLNNMDEVDKNWRL